MKQIFSNKNVLLKKLNIYDYVFVKIVEPKNANI